MRQKGFTLIEILIALFIFAIMATLVTLGLNSVLKARERTQVVYENIRQLQIFSSLLSQDFSQLRGRAIINNNGTPQAAVIGNFQRVEFTNGADAPSNGFRQSHLARVAYVFQNNQILRLSWPVLDRAPGTAAASRVILKNVSDFRLEYFNDKGKRVDQWPDESSNQVLPKAIRISFSYKNLGNVQRLWIIYQ